jgi:hypothetical protein
VTREHPPERDVEEMEERVERLGTDIEGARSDWERKRKDPGVPGAEPPPDEDTRDPSTEREHETEDPDG